MHIYTNTYLNFTKVGKYMLKLKNKNILKVFEVNDEVSEENNDLATSYSPHFLKFIQTFC